MSDGALAPAPSRLLRLERPGAELRRRGYSVQRGLLDRRACEALATLFDTGSAFRSQVIMQRHGYGRGEYRYFDYPLPPTVAELRAALYEALLPAARETCTLLERAFELPDDLQSFLVACRRAGQRRPTPLLLRYGPGDYNRLHRDLYGDVQFPFQATLLLSRPGVDFSGGEFCLSFQRYRSQSRIEIVPLEQGDLVVFPVDALVLDEAGDGRARRERVRHGVSRLHSGRRLALGLPLHDAA